MKRIIVTLLVGALLAAAPISGWAVDKKQKEDPPKVAPKPALPAPATDSAKKQPAKVKPAKPVEGKKYDNFVDGNNNGIDDRLEKDKKKPDK